jgi:hypothetical protein
VSITATTLFSLLSIFLLTAFQGLARDKMRCPRTGDL